MTLHRSDLLVWRARTKGSMPQRTFTSVAIACLLAVAGCGTVVASKPTQRPSPTQRTATATSTPTNLPNFTDWRAAYLAADGKLHVVTLDGRQDLAGAPVTGMWMNGLSLSTAHI